MPKISPETVIISNCSVVVECRIINSPTFLRSRGCFACTARRCDLRMFLLIVGMNGDATTNADVPPMQTPASMHAYCRGPGQEGPPWLGPPRQRPSTAPAHLPWPGGHGQLQVDRPATTTTRRAGWKSVDRVARLYRPTPAAPPQPPYHHCRLPTQCRGRRRSSRASTAYHHCDHQCRSNATFAACQWRPGRKTRTTGCGSA